MSTTITMPQIIDDGRLDTILFILHESRRLGNRADKIILDWKETISLSPAGHAILCCLFDSFIEQRNDIQLSNINKKLKSIAILHNLAKLTTFNCLPDPKIQGCTRTNMILRGNGTSIDIAFQEYLKETFGHHLTDDQLYACTHISNELMQNTVDHSTGERYYLYAGTWKDEFHLGVLDMGITIPAKLEQKYHRANDVEYLELALEKGAGTRRTRVGGFGLYYLFEHLKSIKGKLTLISRNAQIRRYFNTRRSQKNMLKYTLNGTWCFTRMKLEM